MCFFPAVYAPQENPTWIARKNNMSYSSWKLFTVAKLIKGKQIVDAINAAKTSNKKGADIVAACLNAARKNGER